MINLFGISTDKLWLWIELCHQIVTIFIFHFCSPTPLWGKNILRRILRRTWGASFRQKRIKTLFAAIRYSKYGASFPCNYWSVANTPTSIMLSYWYLKNGHTKWWLIFAHFIFVLQMHVSSSSHWSGGRFIIWKQGSSPVHWPHGEK